MFMSKTLNVHQHPPIAKVVVGNEYPYVEKTQVTSWSLILPISQIVCEQTLHQLLLKSQPFEIDTQDVADH